MDDDVLIVVVEEADVVAVEERENGSAGDSFAYLGTILLTACCRSLSDVWKSSSNDEVDEDAEDESYDADEKDSVGDERAEHDLIGYPRGVLVRNLVESVFELGEYVDGSLAGVGVVGDVMTERLPFRLW